MNRDKLCKVLARILSRRYNKNISVYINEKGVMKNESVSAPTKSAERIEK